MSKDRGTIGASLDNVSGLSEQLARLLTQTRPYLKDDIAELRKVLQALNKPEGQAVLSGTIERLPDMLRRQTRVGSYGSWYNYYLCDFQGKIILPDIIAKLPGVALIQDQLLNLTFHSTAARCEP